MNESIFLTINSWTGQNLWLDKFMVFSAEWLGYFLILFLFIPLCLTFFIKSDRISHWSRVLLLEFTYYKKMLVVSLGSAIVSRFIFVTIIRFFYHHLRPFLVLQNTHLLIAPDNEYSFPSGHATFYFALATGVYLYNKKLGKIYFVAATLMGLARIFVGVHWLLDVIAGAGLGVATAILTNLLNQNPQGDFNGIFVVRS